MTEKAARLVVNALSCAFILCTPALGCPDLSGTYQCPAWGDQPITTLTVSNTKNREDATVYRFKYVTRQKESIVEYIVYTGPTKAPDGHTNHCTSKEFIHKRPTDAGAGTANFINAKGDYEATYGGKTQIICARLPK